VQTQKTQEAEKMSDVKTEQADTKAKSKEQTASKKKLPMQLSSPTTH
jgi:hypothetical protein